MSRLAAIILALIAVSMVVGGAYLVWLSPFMDREIAAYRQAKPCSSVSQPSDECYLVLPVTVTSAVFRVHKYGSQEEVGIDTPAGSTQLTFHTSARLAGITPGAAGTVRVYNGKPVMLSVGGSNFPTDYDPSRQQAQARTIGWFSLLLGALFLVIVTAPLWLTLRSARTIKRGRVVIFAIVGGLVIVAATVLALQR